MYKLYMYIIFTDKISITFNFPLVNYMLQNNLLEKSSQAK
jgi:hypothetical protein